MTGIFYVLMRYHGERTGYRNESQYIKLTLEKKILLPLLQGFEPATFQLRVWRSNHWVIPRFPYGSKLSTSYHLLTSRSTKAIPPPPPPPPPPPTTTTTNTTTTTDFNENSSVVRPPDSWSILRFLVRVLAGAARKSSPGSTFCADSYFGVRSTPVLPQ